VFDQFRRRSNKLEHIDTGNYTAEEYEGCIVELQRVNQWLGDARALKQSLLADIAGSVPGPVSVLDIGAGSGELLGVTAEWARAKNRDVDLVGLELNARMAKAIHDRDEKNIRAVRGDALQLPFPDNAFDYCISSLFAHHLSDQQLITVLQEMSRVASRKIFVIDLHRHPIAYFLYTTVARLFLHNRLLRHDGALSILRSFKPHELLELARQAGLTNITLKRRLPFRLVLEAEKKIGNRIAIPEEADEVRIAS
jgi:ubiquinone/menaquinone biosynthesis C-methylase UbiE